MTLVHRAAGNFPAIYYKYKGVKIIEKVLSVFIDESGDFGRYDVRSPYYLVVLIFHNQSVDLTDSIRGLEAHLHYLNYPEHAIHTGPLIRRESIYKNELIEDRKKLFNALFNFSRKTDFSYAYTLIRKNQFEEKQSLINRQTKAIMDLLILHQDYLKSFDKIIIYYDNGQIELNKILTLAFQKLFSNVEFRKVRPIEYKLFQTADLVCTLELLALKIEHNMFTRSEKEFFGTIRDFKKNYLKWIRKKRL